VLGPLERGEPTVLTFENKHPAACSQRHLQCPSSSRVACISARRDTPHHTPHHTTAATVRIRSQSHHGK